MIHLTTVYASKQKDLFFTSSKSKEFLFCHLLEIGIAGKMKKKKFSSSLLFSLLLDLLGANYYY